MAGLQMESSQLMPDILETSDIARSPVDTAVVPGSDKTALIPLCVDLDGTLVKTDLLVEGLVSVLTSPKTLRKFPQLLTSDRALLKKRVASIAQIDVKLLPYNEEFLEFLRHQKSLGRTLILATAADETVAHAVADHLGIFDEVLCSDGVTNLKSGVKAQALVERFGRGGFDYAGNDHADLAVWREASTAIVVNAPGDVRRKLRQDQPTNTEFSKRDPLLRSALKAMRPHQWSKNLLVFVPMVMAHAVGDLHTWLRATAVFLAFCATASCIYLVNDILDLTADRKHVRKRKRPFASGRLRVSTGLILAALCGTVGLGLSILIGSEAVILIYAAISITYSLKLKTYPIVDVFVLASLYTIRVLGGGVATGYEVSLWLLAFSGFLFLSLALIKRTGEMEAVARSGLGTARRGYVQSDLPVLNNFGCAAAFASSIVLALFVNSNAATLHYATPGLLWGVVPLILFWQCRLWLATARGYMHDDPIVYAARDWVSWIVVGAVLVIIMAATAGVSLKILGISSQ